MDPVGHADSKVTLEIYNRVIRLRNRDRLRAEIRELFRESAEPDAAPSPPSARMPIPPPR